MTVSGQTVDVAIQVQEDMDELDKRMEAMVEVGHHFHDHVTEKEKVLLTFVRSLSASVRSLAQAIEREGGDGSDPPPSR